MAQLHWFKIHGGVTKQMTEDEAEKLRNAGKTVVKYKSQFNSKKKLKPASKKTLKHNKKKKQKSLQYLSTTIDSERRSFLVKGISECGFCKASRLECRSYFLLSGSKILVCNDCAVKRHRFSPSKKANWKNNLDALDHAVSGSYGSGKASR
ncbi:hypothetical protein BCT86_09960 [Vibrio breoganii]|uniref:hypothetical protein n=1 Tax=Vibrio breoganii TaxID=553239 RepID=UPI000C8628E6|nr:hypothetical protein [Vibrio breoganii]PML07194.1 hypothetical protein BCT86_09960 [Vibrio breoganii]